MLRRDGLTVVTEMSIESARPRKGFKRWAVILNKGDYRCGTEIAVFRAKVRAERFSAGVNALFSAIQKGD